MALLKRILRSLPLLLISPFLMAISAVALAVVGSVFTAEARA